MLVGPGNLCIRWMVSQFRRMARRSPLESGRQRPKSVLNKMPLAQFLRARRFRMCVDLPVYTLYGLEEACLDVSEVDVGFGPRKLLSVDKVIVVAAFACRILLGSLHCLVVAGCSSMRQHFSLPSARRPNGCISASGTFPGTPSLSSRLRRSDELAVSSASQSVPLLTESVRSDAHQDRM